MKNICFLYIQKVLKTRVIFFSEFGLEILEITFLFVIIAFSNKNFKLNISLVVKFTHFVFIKSKFF